MNNHTFTNHPLEKDFIEKPKLQIESFSQGKDPNKNEDAYFFDFKNGIFIICDGGTDKSGNTYEGKTGGEIASLIASEVAKTTPYNGQALVQEINNKIMEYYTKNNIDIGNPIFRFSTTLVVAKKQNGTIVVTQVGDTSFRINGKEIYDNSKIIDTITATIRQQYILTYGEDAVSEARNFILPILKYQYQFQNSQKNIIFSQEMLQYFFSLIQTDTISEKEKQHIFQETEKILSAYFGQDLSYGFCDGTNTPSKFIKVFEFDENEITSLEIFSDGYFQAPNETSLDAWEKTYNEVEKEDPLKYKKYPCTKTKDDRTVIVINFKNHSIEQQRETLLSLNYDKLYGVYELLEETDTNLDFHLLKNCLVAFENQIPNLKGLGQTPDMSIIDLKSLSEGKIKVLHGPEIGEQERKIVMCSGGMIDLFISKNKKGENHVHMLTTLRDANAGTSLNQRTTVAGRCLGENIRKDIEIETAEESPFLGKINEEFYLAVGNNNFDYVKGSIISYLENKYNPNNPELKKMFERGFRGMKYEDLGEILRQIVENNRFVQYNYQELNNISGLQHIIKKVKIGKYEENFYVVYNDKLNTYELKLIKQFESFPQGFEFLGKRPNRLFLESSNQYPRFNRIQNATKINPSGAIKIFTEHISQNVDEIIKAFNES